LYSRRKTEETFEFLQKPEIFLFSDGQTGYGAHPASYKIDILVLSWGVNPLDVIITNHQHVVLRLRMGGAIPLLALYTFIAWTGTTLDF